MQKITIKPRSELIRTTSTCQPFWEKLGAVLLILSPPLASYVAISQFSIGDLCVILALIFCVLSVRPSLFLISSMCLVALIVFISLIVLISENVLHFNFLRAVFYLVVPFIFLSIRSNFYVILIKRYQDVVTVCMLLLIAQSMFYTVTGKVISLQLPLSVYEVDTLIVRDVVTQGFRTGGIFSEPSYYAIYVLPALYLFATRGMMLKYSLLILSILFSTSGLGVFAAIISIIWFFRKIKFKYWVICIALMALLLLIFESQRELVISRCLDILIDGGSLKERVFPIVDIFEVSIENFGLVSSVLHQQVSDKETIVWYNSLIYMIAMFGWLSILPIFTVYYKLGVGGAMIFSTLLFTTNAFSSPFLIVVLVCWYAIRISPINYTRRS